MINKAKKKIVIIYNKKLSCQYHTREEKKEKYIGDSPLLCREHCFTAKKNSLTWF